MKNRVSPPSKLYTVNKKMIEERGARRDRGRRGREGERRMGIEEMKDTPHSNKLKW